MTSAGKTIVALVIALIVSNYYWTLRVQHYRLNLEKEKTSQAKDYAKKIEYQHAITKSSIETVTQETNLYMNLNDELQNENDKLRNDMAKMLKNNACANTDIPADVRSRVLSQSAN